METITKNQHYVPQFILRGFETSESSEKLNIYDVPRHQIRPRQGIKKVFSQNYFYDKDNVVEKYLNNDIETPASIEINKLKNGDFSGLNSNSTLIKFLSCQNSRTIESREDVLNFLNASFEQMISSLNLGIKNPEQFRVMPDGKDAMRDFTAAIVMTGEIDSFGMEDLQFHLLVNETDIGFVISDHPVGKYNWFYRDLKDGQVGSMMAKGVQLFLPISTNLTLCAYDSSVYKYGKKRGDVSSIKNKNDVDWLNQLQVRPARSFVGFSDAIQEEYVTGLVSKYNGKVLYARKSQHLYQHDMDDEKIKIGHAIYTTQKKLTIMPSFMKVHRRARQFASKYYERNPELSQYLQNLKERIIEA